MTDPVGVYATVTPVIAVGGTALTLMYGPVLGGIIANPATALGQGLATVEVLYVNIVGVAAASETGTTVAIQPGQFYYVPPNQTTNVSVNAASSGHKFTAVTFQPGSTVIPAELLGLVNPCLQDVIPSYLYQQYANDDDLQAFVAAYNTLAQEYVTWLNAINLPVYTGPLLAGDLLDWVALGLYGVVRPVLSSGNATIRGGFNTKALNAQVFNGRDVAGAAVFTPVNDDIFKRVLTWKLYKGDGKVIDVRWLKRRIVRFLTGSNGTDPDTADTQQISITFGGNDITLSVIDDSQLSVINGLLYNGAAFNRRALNLSPPESTLFQTIETFTHDNQININLLSPPLPNYDIFKEAVEQGVLDLPFQFKFVVNIVP